MPRSTTCAKKFAIETDMYANGVGLSYNGQRKHATLPGSICSIISGLLIGYQIVTTFKKYADPEYTNVTRNNKELLLDQAEPPVFDVTRDQISLMNQI